MKTRFELEHDRRTASEPQVRSSELVQWLRGLLHKYRVGKARKKQMRQVREIRAMPPMWYRTNRTIYQFNQLLNK